MSLLNTTNDGLPNVLVALCGVLVLEQGPVAEADLMARVAPEGIIQDEGKMVRQTLNRWVELGLLVRAEGNVSLSDYFPPAAEIKRDDFDDVMRRAVRKCALAPENNADLWATESAKAADLTRSLCLLLAQDVYRTGVNHLDALETKQVVNADLRLIRNNTRVNGLKKWAHFLGFVRQPDGSDIDPTVAVTGWRLVRRCWPTPSSTGWPVPCRCWMAACTAAESKRSWIARACSCPARARCLLPCRVRFLPCARMANSGSRRCPTSARA
jgi:hypothetical protein